MRKLQHSSFKMCRLFIRTYIHTHTHTHTHTYRQIDRQTDRQTDIPTYLHIYINDSNFARTKPNGDFLDPYQPENYQKEREEGKGARARKKKSSNSAFFYSVDNGQAHTLVFLVRYFLYR